jgi:Protein of unknown function (DUF1275)
VAGRFVRPGSTGGEHPPVPPGDSRVFRLAVPAIAVLFAACAGATAALAFFGLGQAFAGIVTGNLVTVGVGGPAHRDRKNCFPCPVTSVRRRPARRRWRAV